MLIWAGGIVLRAFIAASSRSLWGDEIHTWYWATQPDWRSILNFCSTVNHPPLYYLVLKPVLAVFGERENVFRFVSAVAGSLALWALYRLAKELARKKVAALSAFLMAVSAYFIHSSGEIRSYALMGLFASLNIFLFVRSQKKPKYLWTYILSSPLIALTEHIGIFVPFGITLFILIQRKWRMLRVQCLALLLHLPWLWLALHQAFQNEKVQDAGRLDEYWKAGILLKKAAGLFWHFTCGYRYSMLTLDVVAKKITQSPYFWMHGILTAAGIFLFFQGWLLTRRRSKNLFLLTATVFVIPLLVLLAAYPIRLTARYLIFASPFFFIAIAAALAQSRRWLSVSFITAFTFINLCTDFYMIRSPMDAMHKDDFKSLIVYLKEHADEKTALVGSQHHRRYFVKGLGLPPNVKYFDGLTTLDKTNTAPFQKLWNIRMGNMHPAVTERILSEDTPFMNSLEFDKKSCEHFGGEEGLTYACLYEKKRD